MINFTNNVFNVSSLSIINTNINTNDNINTNNNDNNDFMKLIV